MPRLLPRSGGRARQFARAGLLVVATGLLSPALRAQTLLGSMAVDISGGAAGSYVSTPFTLSGHLEFTDVVFDPPVFQIALDNGREFTSGDAGFTFTIDGSTAGFTDLAALLTNGADDSLTWQHAGGGFTTSETTYFSWTYGVSLNGVDLIGYSISSIQFTIDSLSFDPVSDPGWTDHEFRFTMAVYGPSAIPEPSTHAALAGLGALALAGWHRHRRAVASA